MLASFLSRFSNNVLVGVGVRVRVRVGVQRNLKGKIKCTTKPLVAVLDITQEKMQRNCLRLNLVGFGSLAEYPKFFV